MSYIITDDKHYKDIANSIRSKSADGQRVLSRRYGNGS